MKGVNMKKYYKLLFTLLLGVFVFLPSYKVKADVLSDIRINSETTEPSVGELPEFTATTSTDHASIEAYGSNTIWVHWEDGYSSWSGFGSEVPSATLNPNSHYGMRLCVQLESGYEFNENTKIFFNDVDITGVGHTIIDNGFSWGAYVYIDLGSVDIGEPVYTIVYDYNGGTKNGKESETYYWVSFAINCSYDNLMEDVIAPEGKVLDYILVNGEKKDIPFGLEINQDYNIKYVWKDNTTHINEFKLSGVPYPIVGSAPKTNTIKIATPGYENAKFEWIEESTNKVMDSSSKFKANQHYILSIYDFSALEGYALPDNLGESKIISNIKYLQSGYIGERPEVRIYFNSVSQTKVKITFNANGGSVKTKSKNVNTYSTYGTLPTPTRKGYKFTGWYTAKSGGTKIVASTATNNTKARTLYARWSIIKYKITYNLNGGTNNKSNPLTYTINNKIVFKNPTKKGYIFKGWFKDSKFKSKMTSIAKGTTGNKTVYAKWQTITYKVVYNANSGSGKMSNSTGLKYDKAFTLRANSFKRTGYKFIGWNTKKDASGKSYENKAKVKNLTAKNGATVTLYAQWKRNSYKITYNLNGGINNSANPATYNVSSTITFKNAKKKGCTFKGWYTANKGGTKVTGIKKGTTGNKVLYARWVYTSYKITYNLNGGTNSFLNITSYTIKDNVSFWEPSRKGYLFLGWYTDSVFTNPIYEIIKGSTGNKVLYAKWGVDNGQNRALAKAVDYLQIFEFSYLGLIDQLEFEGFTHEEAVYAANNCGADWYEQAKRQAISYLESSAFSYLGLIEQLEFEDFTHEEAVYAANNCGANWYEQAVRKAKDYLESSSFSRSELIEQLEYGDFTHEEAVYGVDNCGVVW